jgi:hypothetical protein
MYDHFDPHIIRVPHLPLGTLRRDYSQRQTTKQLSPALTHRLHKTWRRELVNPQRHTVWLGKDDAVITYRVPREMLNHDHLEQLSRSITTLPPSSPTQNTSNTRGIQSKIYQNWAPLRPILDYSTDYIQDGNSAAAFMRDNRDLWNEMSFIFGHVWTSEARMFKKFPLPNFPQRLAGSWTGCAVNIGTEDDPIKTEIHRDVNEGLFGVSCLCPFGNFTGGDVMLWEACLRIELRAGDLLFFFNGILHHSNQDVTGQRHSLVAFTSMNVFHYWQREYKFEDPRLSDLKIRRQHYQKIKEANGKMEVRPSKAGKHKMRINRRRLVEKVERVPLSKAGKRKVRINRQKTSEVIRS